MYKIFTTFTNIQDGNLAYHVTNDRLSVEKNRNNLLKKLQINSSNNFISMNQIHSNIVLDCNSADKNSCDGIITDQINTPLMVLVADCIPMLFLDKIQGVIAAVHAGREGTYNYIVLNTINKMVNSYTSKKENIEVIMGPSIRKCCYEVSNELTQEAKEKFSEEFIDGRFIDLQGINRKILIDNGLSENNIKDYNICTKCNSHKYFSYRDNQQCGRFAGIIMMSKY